MTVEREQLLGIAHAERQRLGRMIQYAEPSSWEIASAAAGWWNRDVMAHLGASDTAAAQLIADEPAQELDEYRAQLGAEPFTVEGWNAWTVNRRSGLELRQVLEVWGRAADAVLEFAARLTREEWETSRYPWVAGEIAPRYLIQSRVVEWFLHGEDMRATNGVSRGWQPMWQHWPVYLTVDLGVRMLPWALARAGYDVRGRSVQIDLEGAGEGSWHWGLGAGEVPPANKKPDAILIGRAPQFALVAGQRLSPDAVLDSGAVVLGADTGLAELILRTIRAYA
ncbi:MAG: maleylpyruvate isomerase N-terminal domain-containing protein [Actinomycetota bacterium]